MVFKKTNYHKFRIRNFRIDMLILLMIVEMEYIF